MTFLDDISPELLFVGILEGVVWLLGLILLGRLLFTSRGRALLTSPAPLAAWPVTLSLFLFSALLVCLGGYYAQVFVANLSNEVLGEASRNGELWQLLQGITFQLGLLLTALISGLVIHLMSAKREIAPSTVPASRPQPVIAGIVTFAIAIPVISLTGLLWKFLLEVCGIPADLQDAVNLFINAGSEKSLFMMTVLAVVVAPLTEELLFRAGLFRYLRTRIPRWLAFVVPALVFAVMHANLGAFVPLFVLGVLFAYAYERSGNIAVPMIAHALFNLHTVVLLMAGVTA